MGKRIGTFRAIGYVVGATGRPEDGRAVVLTTSRQVWVIAGVVDDWVEKGYCTGGHVEEWIEGMGWCVYTDSEEECMGAS